MGGHISGRNSVSKGIEMGTIRSCIEYAPVGVLNSGFTDYLTVLLVSEIPQTPEIACNF